MVIYGIFSLNFFQHVKRVRLVIGLTIFNKIKITSITLEKGGCRLSAVDAFNLYFLPCECCKEFRLQDSACFWEQKNSALACWQLRYCLTFHVHEQHHIPKRGHGMFPYKGRGNSWQSVMSVQSCSFSASLCVKRGCCWSVAAAGMLELSRHCQQSLQGLNEPEKYLLLPKVAPWVWREAACQIKQCQLYVGCALKEKAPTQVAGVGCVLSSTVQQKTKVIALAIFHCCYLLSWSVPLASSDG